MYNFNDPTLRVPLVLRTIDQITKEDFSLGGRLTTSQSPERELGHKYSVSTLQYSEEKYPDFLSGPSYLLSRQAVKVIYREALNMAYFPLEDVFLTGQLKTINRKLARYIVFRLCTELDTYFRRTCCKQDGFEVV